MYKKNAWIKYQDENEKNKLLKFNDEYIKFLSTCKTERECTEYSIELLKENGFKNIKDIKELKAGDKIYAINKNKNVLAFVIGDEPLEAGLNILGAHIDSPRLDIKQNPLYDDKGFAYLDTHYYGGIVKYQWVSHPLALHGVIVKKNGEVVKINIGENPNDPVVGITDLLVHLSAEKNSKPANRVIEGEALDITIGHFAIMDEDKPNVMKAITDLLKNNYNIDIEDFVSAEIEAVPAGPARDFGLDRSMIMGYGHDDRVCAYTSLRAVIDAGKCKYTTCAYLVDKEEIGSVGATGAQSAWFSNTLAELINLEGTYSELKLRRAIANSRMLSSDVSAGYDPLYAGVFERNNSAYLGEGICFNKYTGARGKSGCNDASPEYIAKIRQIMDDDNIYYQTAELGKVDAGGGGTIAYIMGNMDMYVIDAGVAVLSMHAPNEIVSKADVYEAYLAYMTFIKKIF